MVADPKEQRTKALNERVDAGSLGYRFNELSRMINISLPSS